MIFLHLDIRKLTTILATAKFCMALASIYPRDRGTGQVKKRRGYVLPGMQGEPHLVLSNLDRPHTGRELKIRQQSEIDQSSSHSGYGALSPRRPTLSGTDPAIVAPTYGRPTRADLKRSGSPIGGFLFIEARPRRKLATSRIIPYAYKMGDGRSQAL